MIERKILKSKMLIWIAASVLVVGIILFVTLISRSFVKITINPPGSRLEINNMVVLLDENGYGKATVKPGNNKIEVSKEGYIGFSSVVDLKGGKTSTYQIELRENPTSIAIGNSEVANDNVQFISEADEDNSMFYLGNNGRTMYKAIFNIDSEEKITTTLNKPITNPILSNIKGVIWSPNKDSAIFKKDNGVYTFFDFKKYDFVNQEEVPYGENIGDLAWSPDDSKIAYYYAPPGGEKSLIFANKTNSEMTRVANLETVGIENPYLAWSPDSEWLIVIPRNKDLSTNKIYLFNTYTRTLKTVNDSGNNVEAVFNRDNSKILYTTYSVDPTTPVKYLVSEMDKDGNNKKSLELRAYLSKIIFPNTNSSDIIVATYNNEKAVDAIFPFNLDSKSESGFKINLPANQYVTDISISNDDKFLLYVAGNQFYAMSLKK